MSPRRLPTYEEYVEKYFADYQRLKQFRQQLDATPPTLTLEKLKEKARSKALAKVHEDTMLANRAIVDIDAELQDDADFREQRITDYEAVGEWDDAGDMALLISLVELETQHRAIRRELTRATTRSDKEAYWTALRQNAESQKSLQVTLGIDKKTRENARSTGNPMDNWQEIKDEVGDWVDMLVEEFTTEVEEVKTEEELKDLMKVKLSWPLAIVDSVVYNLKRVNGQVKEGNLEA